MKKKGKFSTILLIIIFLAGLSLVLYPSVANYVNSMHQSRAIAAYAERVAQITAEEYDELWQAAEAYNAAILERSLPYSQSQEEAQQYNELLNLSGDGTMGYIEIPSIEVSLPVYHGTSDSVLQRAVGHIAWTSLPVGGESTHSVLSGHRGLPSAKLFTNLDQLVEGDVFMLRVLDEVLTYQVDQILIVLPNEVEALTVTEGQDYCTLVTCTPYGINTHRLLVRGHRIENAAEAAAVHITTEAVQIEELLVAGVIAIPLLVILLILLFI